LLNGRNIIRNTLQPQQVASDDSNHRLRPEGTENNSNHLLWLETHLYKNYEITKQKHPHLTFDIYKRHFNRLENIQQRFIYKYATNHNIPTFRWLKSFHDHIIRDEKDFQNHLNYIYNNAVKHHLVENPEDWKWMWIIGMKKPLI
jgi:REP element-mobilizing transposase RayT